MDERMGLKHIWSEYNWKGWYLFYFQDFKVKYICKLFLLFAKPSFEMKVSNWLNFWSIKGRYCRCVLYNRIRRGLRSRLKGVKFQINYFYLTSLFSSKTLNLNRIQAAHPRPSPNSNSNHASIQPFHWLSWNVIILSIFICNNSNAYIILSAKCYSQVSREIEAI